MRCWHADNYLSSPVHAHAIQFWVFRFPLKPSRSPSYFFSIQVTTSWQKRGRHQGGLHRVCCLGAGITLQYNRRSCVVCLCSMLFFFEVVRCTVQCSFAVEIMVCLDRSPHEKACPASDLIAPLEVAAATTVKKGSASYCSLYLPMYAAETTRYSSSAAHAWFASLQHAVHNAPDRKSVV